MMGYSLAGFVVVLLQLSLQLQYVDGKGLSYFDWIYPMSLDYGNY
jgi:hypothetical protein